MPTIEEFKKQREQKKQGLTINEFKAQRQQSKLGTGARSVLGVSSGLSPLAFETELTEQQFQKDLSESLTLEERKIAGIQEPKYVPYAVGEVEKAKDTKAFQRGELAGTIGRFAAGYALGGGAVESAVAPGIAKLGLSKAGTTLATEFAKDVIIGQPLNLTEGLAKGKTGTELAKYMGEQAIIDVVSNAVFFGLGKGFKALKRADSKQISEAVEKISKETTIPKETIEEVVAKQSVDEVKQVIPEVVEKATPEIVEETSVQNVRRFTQTALQSPTSGEELKQIIKNNPNFYTVQSNKEGTELAKGIVRDNLEASKNMILSGKQFDNALEPEIGRQLVKELQLRKQFDESFMIIDKLAEKGTKAGQDIQLFSLWRMSTPEGMSRWAKRALDNAGVKVDDKFLQKIAEDMQFAQSASKEQLRANILSKAKGIRKDVVDRLLDNANMDRLNELNIALVMKDVQDKIPISMARKLSTGQAISHLLNAKTMLRNTFGNLTFSLGEQMSRAFGSGFDKMLAQKTGKRTIAGLPKYRQSFQSAIDRSKQSLEEILLGVEILDKDKFNMFRGKTFKAPVLTQLEDALSIGLRTPDEFFKGFTKADSLYSQLKARGVNVPDKATIEQLMDLATKEELAQAEQEALYSTFQDNSFFANTFQSLKDTLNRVGIGKRVRGASGLMTREFGLGDLVIKYTKVPGNLISRGIEYTPAGYLKALQGMSDLNKAGQRNVALQLGRATTGTGLITMAIWLRKKGVITGSSSEQSWDEMAFDKAQGLGNYKINTDGLARLMSGGDPSPQKGDKFESYNWNQPLNTAFAVGSIIADNKDDVQLADITSKTIEEMLDIPTLNIVQSMFYEGMSKEPNKAARIISVPAVQGVSGFVPAPIRQLSQYLDPTLRKTTAEGIFPKIGERIQSSTPIAREGLQPQVSPMGRELQATQGFAETFIKPGITTEYNPVAYSDQLKRLSQLTDKTSVFPARKAPKQFVINKVSIELSPDEQTRYQKIAGRYVDDLYSQILTGVDIDRLNDTQREELVYYLEKAKSTSREFAKNIILAEKLKKK